MMERDKARWHDQMMEITETSLSFFEVLDMYTLLTFKSEYST